ncbi:hypothetical protein [Terrabacter ginsenosidimutans]
MDENTPALTVCDRCERKFDLDEVKAEFDRYYTGSADWKYDQVFSECLCADCAETDAESRWMGDALKAADGPPPAGAQSIWREMH